MVSVLGQLHFRVVVTKSVENLSPPPEGGAAPTFTLNCHLGKRRTTKGPVETQRGRRRDGGRPPPEGGRALRPRVSPSGPGVKVLYMNRQSASSRSSRAHHTV